MKPALAFVLTLLAAPAIAGTVEVAVSGVRSDTGDVLIAICDRATFLQPRCAYWGRTPAKTGTVVIKVTGVPPGTYAAQAFQDENGNGKVDRSLLGIPTEGIGFSRDARMRFGPPNFDDAAFTLTDDAKLALTLRYY
jgi:uncharacterized protein (DUF2141 family)